MSEDLGLSGNNLPAVCYSDCNDAYEIAESTGKSDALCEPCGTFRKAYNQCANCIKAYEGDFDISDFDNADFRKFVDFCDFLGRTTKTGVFTGTDSKVQTLVYVIPVPDSTTANCGTTLSAHATSTSTGPTASIIQSSLSSRTSFSSSTTTKAASLGSSTTEPGSNQDSGASKAWIVGPVIGGIVGVIIIIAIVFLLGRKRKRLAYPSDEGWMYNKAELHSESIPPKKPEEIEGQEICELVGSMPPPMETSVHEVPTNEIPSTGERLASDDMSTPSRWASTDHARLTNEVPSTDEVLSTGEVPSTDKVPSTGEVPRTDIMPSTNEVPSTGEVPYTHEAPDTENRFPSTD